MSFRILSIVLALLAATGVSSNSAYTVSAESVLGLDRTYETMGEMFQFEGNDTKSLPPSDFWQFTSSTGGRSEYLVQTWPANDLDTAKRYCEGFGQGSELVALETLQKFNFIRDNLKRFSALRDTRYGFWTSCTDLYPVSQRDQGQYWSYSGLPIDITFWNVGEPNNKDGPARDLETCVSIKEPTSNGGSAYGLNDELCTELLAYICERHLPDVDTRPRPLCRPCPWVWYL